MPHLVHWPCNSIMALELDPPGLQGSKLTDPDFVLGSCRLHGLTCCLEVEVVGLKGYAVGSWGSYAENLES